ncbi:uncharacterized protein GGS25DRAFT_470783 [Hypoxylon fragiforme]|uniref:uncharacterized protein n=1 Tax=Hypoxylon fragiforme TaxID=63214 RepID=UPI0020C630FD|nr:uncharacterized protein GGS25DRAFT_470783 [Hypoxylon fragiforme]KAI2614214.1 hypothetical protein GGS25DRAFT_470783 [Hypoxylon fragiforme]
MDWCQERQYHLSIATYLDFLGAFLGVLALDRSTTRTGSGRRWRGTLMCYLTIMGILYQTLGGIK